MREGCSCRLSYITLSLWCQCDVVFYYACFVLSFLSISPFCDTSLSCDSSVSAKHLLCPVLYKLVSSRFAWQKFVFLFLCHEN